MLDCTVFDTHITVDSRVRDFAVERGSKLVKRLIKIIHTHGYYENHHTSRQKDTRKHTAEQETDCSDGKTPHKQVKAHVIHFRYQHQQPTYIQKADEASPAPSQSHTSRLQCCATLEQGTATPARSLRATLYAVLSRSVQHVQLCTRAAGACRLSSHGCCLTASEILDHVGGVAVRPDGAGLGFSCTATTAVRKMTRLRMGRILVF